MSDYDTRHQVRRAVLELVQQAGGKTIVRPLIRSEPAGSKTFEPEPLPGITAAVAVEREGRRQCLESVRYAREDGLTWDHVGEALGYGSRPPDPDPAVRAYWYANPGAEHADWFTWTCPKCAGLIRDYGPELSPHDAEVGHADGCERLAETVRVWDARWEDDNG